MRRSIVPAAILILLIAHEAFAGGAVGLFGGVNFGNLSGDTPANTSYTSRTGFAAGVVGEIDLAEEVILQLAPMYVQRGTNIEIKPADPADPSEFSDLALDYFSLPVLIKLVTGNGMTYFSGGVDLGFLLDATLTHDGQESDTSNVIKDIDIAAVFAFGVMIDIGAPLLTLEARYTQSVTNVAEPEMADDDSGLPVRFRSTGFQLFAGILLPFRK